MRRAAACEHAGGTRHAACAHVWPVAGHGCCEKQTSGDYGRHAEAMGPAGGSARRRSGEQQQPRVESRVRYAMCYAMLCAVLYVYPCACRRPGLSNPGHKPPRAKPNSNQTQTKLKPDSTRRAAPVLPLATSLRAPVRAAGSLPFPQPDSTQVLGGWSVRRQCYLTDGARVPGHPFLTGQMRTVAAAQRHGHVPGRWVPFIGKRVPGAADPPSPPPVDHPEDRGYLSHTKSPHGRSVGPYWGPAPSRGFCVQ